MKQLKYILLMCILLLGVRQVHATDRPSMVARILDVKYYDRAGYSRLIVSLNESVQYSATKKGNEIRIVLAKTDILPSSDGARLQYFSGLMDGVSVDQVKDDSVVVIVVRVKANTVFKLEKTEKPNGLCLDVYPDPSPIYWEDTTSVYTQSSGTQRFVIQPIQTISLNNLASTVTPPQRESAGTTAESSNTMAAVLKVIASQGRMNPLHASVAIALAMMGTGLLLLLLRRRYVRKPTRTVFTAELNEAVSKQVIAPQIDLPVPEDSRDAEPSTVLQSDPDASVLGLARKYGRGLGEISLSLNLKARQRKNRWTKRAQRLVEVADLSRDRGEIAKELGIGRGEVDLAMLFHHLNTPKTLREELV